MENLSIEEVEFLVNLLKSVSVSVKPTDPDPEKPIRIVKGLLEKLTKNISSDNI